MEVWSLEEPNVLFQSMDVDSKHSLGHCVGQRSSVLNRPRIAGVAQASFVHPTCGEALRESMCNPPWILQH